MTRPTPWWESGDGRACLYEGDALSILASMETGTADAVITDPPYSSGGQYRSDRMGSTTAKYVQSDSGNRALPGFSGDNRDQRAYGYWCALWLSEALRVTRPGGVCLLFCDWRQLPVTTDAIQAGGWIWRGIIPWSKPSGSARVQLGRFTASCEYVVWGSNGGMPIAAVEGGPAILPGFFEGAPPRDRVHNTQKPVKVLREMVQICPKGGLVLDLFAGAGTTGVAAVLEGRRFAGCEIHLEHLISSRDRIGSAIRGYRDKGEQLALTPG